MFKHIPVRKLMVLWLAWAITIIGFQNLVTARFAPDRPDNVLMWTDTETDRYSQNDKPYLIDPFMNQQVSMDSEYYISIALYGYDDPDFRTVEYRGVEYSMNYAFFGFYPAVMRVVMQPLKLLDMTPVARATLAGVIVSLLGTLVGMIALYDLAYPKLGEDGAFRAVSYLLVFPTGFFLAQVYTEGLFIALTFSSLALMQRSQQGRRYLLAAAVLAALATLTRAVGAALVPALIVKAFADEPDGYRFVVCPFPWKAIGKGFSSAAIPILTYLVWASSRLGAGFRFVETHFFGRGALQIIPSIVSMGYSWDSVLGRHTIWTGNDPVQTSVYFALEFLAVGLGLLACIKTFRKYPHVAAFGLFAWTIAVFSGAMQSQIRYMLVIPSVFLYLSQCGRKPEFDRAWTTISVLLLGLLTTLFSFDFWVA